MKTILRAQALERRQSLPEASRAAAAAAITDAFLSEISLPPHAVVAGYWPIRGEVDDLPLLRRLTAAGHACALPCVVSADGPLVFRRWETQGTLRTGVYGIPEPDGAPVTPQAVLVPMVAFDAQRARLGYGVGYYDRTLAALPSVLKIGLAFDCQLQSDLPSDEKDVRMDVIITEKKVYR